MAAQTGWRCKTAVLLLTLLTAIFLMIVGNYFLTVWHWWNPQPERVSAHALQNEHVPTVEAIANQGATQDMGVLDMASLSASLAERTSPNEAFCDFVCRWQGQAVVETAVSQVDAVVAAEERVETAVSTPPIIHFARTPPPQPALLIIPSLAVTQTITNVLVHNGQWDIAQLGTQVGHLQTTGKYPGDALAMTFIGHVTVPRPDIAPFADLIRLAHGETIVYRWQNSDYLYEVDATYIVPPTSIDKLYVPSREHIVLATCTGWNLLDRTFDERLVVRAKLVEQRPTNLATMPILE